MTDKLPDSLDKLEWVKLRDEMDAGHVQTPMMERFIAKAKGNPFVPIGCVATVTALVCGIRALKTRNSALSQKMMRARVLAQGFTVTAAVVGTYIASRD